MTMTALRKVETWDVELAMWQTSQEVKLIIVMIPAFKIWNPFVFSGAGDRQVLFWVHIRSKSCSMSYQLIVNVDKNILLLQTPSGNLALNKKV